VHFQCISLLLCDSLEATFLFQLMLLQLPGCITHSFCCDCENPLKRASCVTLELKFSIYAFLDPSTTCTRAAYLDTRILWQGGTLEFHTTIYSSFVASRQLDNHYHILACVVLRQTIHIMRQLISMVATNHTDSGILWLSRED
jgi:hypothetical protein